MIESAQNEHSCENNFLKSDLNVHHNANKAKWVLIITAATMFVEIFFGYKTGSMALLADGWHMASHAAALGITYLAYKLAINSRLTKNFNFGGGKIIALGGFTSSIILLFVVILVGIESISRFLNPHAIQFDEALFVAILGLIINFVCAYILRDNHTHNHHDDHHHHDHHGGSHHHTEHHQHSDHHHPHDDHPHNKKSTNTLAANRDHNIQGAYLHVIADALTSVAAIAALLIAKFWGLNFLDPLIGLAASVIILKWAIGLIKATGWELLDGHATNVDFKAIKKRIESLGSPIIDLHVWRIAPKILACELIINKKNTTQLLIYRTILQNEFGIHHVVVEER